MSVTDDKIKQPWDEEGLVRWLFRWAYEACLPQRPRDILEMLGLLIAALVVRVKVDVPADWTIVRVLVSYLVAASATLLLAYLAYYAARGVRRLRGTVA